MGDEERPWYDTVGGPLALILDGALLLLVVAGTTTVGVGWLEEMAVVQASEVPAVPAYVYGYALLGALGYVFTTVVRERNRSPIDLAHYNLRLFAALPLAAGVYLFGGQILGDAAPVRLVAGLAFVAGLFVNLTYQRIGDLADRLLPAEEELAETPMRRDVVPTWTGEGDGEESPSPGEGRDDAATNGRGDESTGSPSADPTSSPN